MLIFCGRIMPPTDLLASCESASLVSWAYGARDRCRASAPATDTVGRQRGCKRSRWASGGAAARYRPTGLQPMPAETPGGSHSTRRADAPPTGACCPPVSTPLGLRHRTVAASGPREPPAAALPPSPLTASGDHAQHGAQSCSLDLSGS